MNDALTSCLEEAAAVRAAGEPGGPAAGGRRPQPEPRRVPGTGPAGRAGGALRPADPAPRQGGRLPRAEAAGRVRLVVQPVDQEEAGLRPGHLPLHPRTPRRALLGPPGMGKSFLVQAIGYQAIKAGFVVLYRSIFDVVRDFLHDEALGDEDKVLARYLKPDLLIIDDMGMKQLPKRSGEYLFEIIMRRYETRSTMMTSQPAAGGLGQADRRRAQRHGDPRPLPAPRRGRADERAELPPAGPAGRVAGAAAGFKTSQSAHRLGGRSVGFKTSQSAPRLRGRPEGGRLSQSGRAPDAWRRVGPPDRSKTSRAEKEAGRRLRL